MTGDAVNTAARLQSAAGAGQTLVSAATHQLTEREFAFEAAGTLALKGKAEPLQVYRLLGVPRCAVAPTCAASPRTGSRRGSSAATSSWHSCSRPRLRVADGGAQVVSLRRAGGRRQVAARRRGARALA